MTRTRAEGFPAIAALGSLTLILALGPAPTMAQESPSPTLGAKARDGRLLVRLTGDIPPRPVKVKVKGPKKYRTTIKVAESKKLRGLLPGRYRILPRAKNVAGIKYVPVAASKSVRVKRASQRSVAVAFRRAGEPSVLPPQPTPPIVAPASPPPAGAVGEVLERINAARAAGVTCDGTKGPALQPIGYSKELGALAQWHADDRASGRDNDFLADLRRSGFTGAFVSETAVVCPRVADADGVLVAMKDWELSCSRLFDPEVDRIGIGYATNSETTNSWTLTFGRSRA